VTIEEVESRWGGYWLETAMVALSVRVRPDGLIEAHRPTSDELEAHLSERFGSPDKLPFRNLTCESPALAYVFTGKT